MKRYLPILGFLLCLLLTFAIYYPGTHGYFQLDDTVNILENDYIKVQSLDFGTLSKSAYSGTASSLKRPISVVSFAINYYFTGMAPYAFKLTNIFIHLLNGIGIFCLSLLLLNSNSALAASSNNKKNNEWIACAIAAAWLLHPLNLSGVLYVVQRMTSLAAFFTIIGLITYVIGRNRQRENKQGWPYILTSLLVFTPLAILSKENGALLPMFLLLTELAFYRFNSPDLTVRRKLLLLFTFSAILPAIAAATFMILHPEWLAATYKIRVFTLTERCMTEARAIWFYLRLLIAPDVSQFGLYHDDFAISHSIFNPNSTVFAVVGLMALFLGALFSLKRHPVAAFGILFFLLGHSMESSILPLELVYEHRNYLPDFGILFALFYYLLSSHRHLESLKARQSFAVVLIAMFTMLTLSRAVQWGDPVQLKQKEVERHPNSVRANIDIAEFYASIPPTSKENAEQLYTKAYGYFAAAAVASPTDTLGLFGLVKLNLQNSLPLEEFWVPELERRIRSSPFSVGTGNYIQYLNNCYMVHSCPINPDIMETLIQAALANKTLTPIEKTQLLLVWSSFLFDTKHKPDEAAKYAMEAAEISTSDPTKQINAITLLINMHKPDEALMLIQKTREKDVFNVYVKLLDNLKTTALSLKK